MIELWQKLVVTLSAIFVKFLNIIGSPPVSWMNGINDWIVVKDFRTSLSSRESLQDGEHSLKQWEHLRRHLLVNSNVTFKG